jgi:NRAMP (natural resistance-associated macrophage protein)-like metal ion transporter
MPEEIIEKVAEAPAVAVEGAIETSKQIGEKFVNQESVKKARAYWKLLGPGLTTGASDDDPSGIATYSQTGAKYGFQLLWLAPFTFPFMAIVQEMCARIGLVTGRGLAANIRLNYPKWVLYTCTILLFGANVLNIGADIGAMAKATQLVLPGFNFYLLIFFFTVLSLILQIFTTYDRYAKYLKWLALILLAYVFSALSIKLNWLEVLKTTVIPTITFSKDQIILIAAVLGTTISPYLFFWQTSQEVEEEILEGKTTIQLRQEETSPTEIRNMRVDVWSGMFLSNLVMFFIIAAAAGTLHLNGITHIETADQAASALRPIAGNQAFFLFALGIIGTGLLAVPVLAGSASYAISESLGWKSGLYRKLKQAYSFYGTIIIAMLIGFIINFSGINAFKALIYSALANAIVAPVVLILILLISSNKKVMGDRVNHPIISALGWLITIVMIFAGVGTLILGFN